jgi:MFS family permease
LSRAFYCLLAAQFAAGLADSTLLIAAVARMHELGAPAWAVPLLKLVFTIAYVVLAPLTGPLADAAPKGRVMLLANGVKIAACALLAAGAWPLWALALGGLGAAAYSPAKYGLVTELLPPRRLVAANAWLEVSTVLAALLGTVLGGLLVSPRWLAWAHGLIAQPSGHHTALQPAWCMVLLLYALALLFNLGLPRHGARRGPRADAPLRRFVFDNRVLWRDPLAQLSLAVTTLFWGVGATLQFLVLRWADERLSLGLDQAAWLQGASALGVIAGAAWAGWRVPLHGAARVLPLGMLMGLLVPLVVSIDRLDLAWPLLMLVGGLAGYFVVPMNALLQHRGQLLLRGSGRSVAVQNFNENLSVLLMLGAYSALTALDCPLNGLAWALGLSIAGAMGVLLLRQRHQQPAAIATRREPA